MLAPALKPGDTIGVMAPSSFVEKADIEKSKALLEKRGYEVFIHPQTYEREHQSAGTHLQKSMAFQGLWQRDDIKAIWTAGGGNRALYLLDIINFEKLKDHPKILIGFSDVTALLNAVYAHTGLVTFHGPVFKELHIFEERQITHALDILAGSTPAYPLEGIKVLHEGRAEGPLIGGNLSLFQYLPQTIPGSFWENSVLFLEDCSEELSRLDRMFLHLRRLGVLDKISGMVLGEFHDLKESGRPFGYSLEDIVREHTENLDIPVIMDAPLGHGKTLYTFPIGAKARLDTHKASLELLEPAAT